MPSHQLGRIQRHELDESLVADVAAVDEYLVAYRIGAFQSDDAVGCFEESAGLLFECVRGMVGGDHVHGAVLDRFDRGQAIPFAAQWWVHLRERAVFEQRLVVQCQIMRCGFAGDGQPFGLRVANGVEGDCGGHVLEVHVHAGFAHEVDVTLHDRQFGVFGDSRHVQGMGYGTFVHGAHVMVFAVLDEV